MSHDREPRHGATGRPGVIRVLVAEDQHLVRGALVALVGLEPDLEVVAEVGRGDQVTATALRTRPDVALLDIEMPGLSGLDAAAELRAALPSCRTLMVTTFGRTGLVSRAMAEGASGFLLKDAPAEQLAAAIRSVADGRTVLDPALAARALRDGPNPLTERERDVLRAARGGAPVAEVAARLFLSHGTVRNHLSSAIGKLGVRNRMEAAETADARGWL
jgi:two-component system response regulator DesR